MPNHCYTTMWVSGPAADVERFQQTIEGHEQFLPVLVPCGAEDDPYDVWGVKWGDCDTEIDGPVEVTGDQEGSLCVRFWTPWGPAIQGLTTVSAMFPTLRFDISYFDEGEAFFGCAVFVNGSFGNCSVDPDDPHYPPFTHEENENHAELVGACFDYCESVAERMLSGQVAGVSA